MRVPLEVRPLLAAALAAPYADRLAAAGPVRWLGAPLQLAHDIASLWAYLARSPVRVKGNGIVYQRDVPKLFDALPQFELHGPHDVMEGPRLTFVLGLLRDQRLVRVRVDDRPGMNGRRELVAGGDPFALLTAEPAELRAWLVTQVRRRAVMAAPAVALAGALEPGTAVTLESFGAALRAMCDVVEESQVIVRAEVRSRRDQESDPALARRDDPAPQRPGGRGPAKKLVRVASAPSSRLSGRDSA
jgi:hypothetical protein